MKEKLIDEFEESINDESSIFISPHKLYIDEDIKTNKSKSKKNESASVCKLIYHLSGKTEVFLIILDTIGSIISAVSGPIMSYTFGGAINDFSDIQDLDKSDPNYQIKLDEFVKNVKGVYTRYLILGTILFISNFFQAFGWQYSAFRQIHKLKENYFTLIISQEQAYFDNNNSFELVTKVQTQLEQIELGLGDKFGFVIQKAFTVISGIVISFIVNWKLSLIVLTVAPLTLFLIFYFTASLKTSSKITKQSYEKAGGIAEEVLYNIQTICSFGNFEFEKKDLI